MAEYQPEDMEFFKKLGIEAMQAAPNTPSSEPLGRMVGSALVGYLAETEQLELSDDDRRAYVSWFIACLVKEIFTYKPQPA